MAIVIKTPVGYAGARGSSVLRITGVAVGQVVEVQIYDARSAKLVGVKNLRWAEEITLDLTSYALAMLDVAPLDTAQPNGFIELPSRSVGLYVKVGGVNSSVVRFVLGAEDIASRKLLSKDAIKPIGWADCGEVAFVADAESVEAKAFLSGQGVPLEISLGGKNVAQGVSAFCLNMGYLSAKVIGAGRKVEEFAEMELRVTFPNSLPDSVVQHYRIVEQEPDGVRLCWINALGGVDYFTFSSHERTAGNDRLVRLVSQLQPRAMVELLTDIADSPRVWRYDHRNRAFESVNVKECVAQLKGEIPTSVTVILK